MAWNNSTLSLWESLKKMGSFEDSYYDKSIEFEMKKMLNVGENATLENFPPEVILN